MSNVRADDSGHESRRIAEHTRVQVARCDQQPASSHPASDNELMQNDKLAISPSQPRSCQVRDRAISCARATSAPKVTKSTRTSCSLKLATSLPSQARRSTGELSGGSSCSSLGARRSTSSSLRPSSSSWSVSAFRRSLAHRAEPPTSELNCTNINNKKLLRQSALSWPSLFPSKADRKVEWSIRRRAQICLMCRERVKSADSRCGLTQSTCSTCSSWTRSTSFRSRPSCSWSSSSSLASLDDTSSSSGSLASTSGASNSISAANKAAASSSLSGANSWTCEHTKPTRRELLAEMIAPQASPIITRAPAAITADSTGPTSGLARACLARTRRWLSSAALESSRAPSRRDLQSVDATSELAAANSPKSTRCSVKLDYISGRPGKALDGLTTTSLPTRESASPVRELLGAGPDVAGLRPTTNLQTSQIEAPKLQALSPGKLQAKQRPVKQQQSRSGEQQRAANHNQPKRPARHNLKQSKVESASDLCMDLRLNPADQRSVAPVHRSRLRSFYLHEFVAPMEQRRSSEAGSKLSTVATDADPVAGCNPLEPVSSVSSLRCAKSFGSGDIEAQTLKLHEDDDDDDDDDGIEMSELAENLASYAARAGCVHCRCRHQLLMLVRSERILNRLAFKIHQGSMSTSEQGARPQVGSEGDQRSIFRVSSLSQVVESLNGGTSRPSTLIGKQHQAANYQHGSEGESEANGSLGDAEQASGDEIELDDDYDEEAATCEPDEEELDEELPLDDVAVEDDDDDDDDEDELVDETEPADGDSSSSSGSSSSISARWSTCSTMSSTGKLPSSAVLQRQRRLALSAASAASRRGAQGERLGVSLLMSEELPGDDDESAIGGEPAPPASTSGTGVGVTLFRKWNQASEQSSGHQRAYEFYRQQLNNPNLIQRRHQRQHSARPQQQPSDAGHSVGRSLSANAGQLDRQLADASVAPTAEPVDWWAPVQQQQQRHHRHNYQQQARQLSLQR